MDAAGPALERIVEELRITPEDSRAFLSDATLATHLSTEDILAELKGGADTAAQAQGQISPIAAVLRDHLQEGLDLAQETIQSTLCEEVFATLQSGQFPTLEKIEQDLTSNLTGNLLPPVAYANEAGSVLDDLESLQESDFNGTKLRLLIYKYQHCT